MKPLVSFVVQCYNTERYAGECIRSILAQVGDYDWEIVAIDDHSPDGTADLLRSFQDPRLRVIVNGENEGHAATLATALRATQGKYIARIDSDDRYKPCFLSTLIPLLEQFPEVGLAYGDASIMDSAGTENVPRCDRQHNGADYKGNELVAILRENFICAPTVCGRREAWLRFLPIPGHLAFSDWYFSVNMARHYDFYYLNRVVADYRVHAGNMHSRTTLDRSEEQSIFWVLDGLRDAVESDGELESAKREAWRSILAKQYQALADKYFGAGMNGDARRCYRKAIVNRPAYLLDPGLVRRFGATILGRTLYERGKALLKPPPATSRSSAQNR